MFACLQIKTNRDGFGSITPHASLNTISITIGQLDSVSQALRFSYECPSPGIDDLPLTKMELFEIRVGWISITIGQVRFSESGHTISL